MSLQTLSTDQLVQIANGSVLSFAVNPQGILRTQYDNAVAELQSRDAIKNPPFIMPFDTDLSAIAKLIAIDEFKSRGKRVELLAIFKATGELIDIDLPGELPTPKPEEEECFIFANIFRLQGSTAPGAPPQQKILVSSGKISCENVDTLRASGHIIEEIEEGEVRPPEVGPVVPQNPFYIKNGVKIFFTKNDQVGTAFKVIIKESLGFREV